MTRRPPVSTLTDTLFPYTTLFRSDNLWIKCPNCEAMLFHRDLEANLWVCQHCGHHMRLEPDRRLRILFDGGRYQTIELPKVAADPLKFRDTKRYTDRLREDRKSTRLNSSH